MNEMSNQRRTGVDAAPETPSAPTDLREWIQRVEALGLLTRIKKEVDWDQEMAAISYMVAHKAGGGPALLFEKINGYSREFRALWNMLGSSVPRIAVALGEPHDLTALELIERCKTKFSRTIPPVFVEAENAPVNTHHMRGADVDVTSFPAPRHWPLDGGRYVGTADAVITRDPEAGWFNVGTYRMMVQDKRHVGLYLSPGKDARLHIERCWSRNEPCELAAIWGPDPTTFIVSAQTFPKTVSELDFIGGILGRPVELVKGEAGSIPYPARAEIVIEGVVYPDAQKLEGPFGEFTGYYGRPEDLAYLVEVNAIHYRTEPILTNTLTSESGMLYAIARSARIWNDLDRLGVPGIRGVYCHPAAACAFGMTIVSLEQQYAGHAPEVLALAAQCPGGAYFSKWIIAVDHDVDPSDIDQVLWAMATRCHPVEDIDILRNTWSTWLDPTQNPPEDRPYGSKALVNACMEHRHLRSFSKRTKIARHVYDRVLARWRDLGLPGSPPTLHALEERGNEKGEGP